MTEPRLPFKNPVFRDGLNMTVRLGDEWIRTWLEGKDEAVVLDGAGKVIGRASIRNVFYIPISAMRQTWAAMYNEPEYRRVCLVQYRFRMLYPDTDSHTTASVVFFHFTPKE